MVIERMTSNIADPWHMYKRIYDYPYSFILDGNAASLEQTRYSFLGCDPFLIMKAKGRKIEVIQGSVKDAFIGNPFKTLDSLLKRCNRPKSEPLYLPLQGGAVGYLSYDLKGFIEKLPANATDDLNVPDLVWGFYDVIFIYDNRFKEGYVVSTGLPENDEKQRSVRAQERLHMFKKIISTEDVMERRITEVKAAADDVLKSNFTRERYIRAVKKALHYIAEGDIYQVNLSQRFSTPVVHHPLDIYEKMRSINPAPMGGFFNFDDLHILSNSPERFMRINEDIIETCPIKGTIERGKDPDDDREMIQKLKNNPKEKAEHVMIVDLERNDLGKVCKFGSVQVKELETIKTYSTLHHMVSRIEGELKGNLNTVEIIEALFPGGSITGAPKVRAMEIIDELEPTVRGIYSGAIGYIDFNGSADFNIPIRTAVIHDGLVHYQSGGGIVADSDPEKEYDETLLKAKAFFNAMDLYRKSGAGIKAISNPLCK